MILQSQELNCVFLVCNDEFAHRRNTREFAIIHDLQKAFGENPDFQDLPIVMVRFNPHSYHIDGKLYDNTIDDGHQKLQKCISGLSKDQLKHKLNLIYIQYDMTGGKLDVFANDKPDEHRHLYRDCVIAIIP